MPGRTGTMCGRLWQTYANGATKAIGPLRGFSRDVRPPSFKAFPSQENEHLLALLRYIEHDRARWPRKNWSTCSRCRPASAGLGGPCSIAWATGMAGGSSTTGRSSALPRRRGWSWTSQHRQDGPIPESRLSACSKSWTDWNELGKN